jgi:hypothetical protein
MEGQNKKVNSSGTVRIDGDKVFWDYENENLLQIDLNEIGVIGEYTNSNGPYFDDWFLAFVSKDGQWHSIPWCADNINDLTKYLSSKFHQDLKITNLAHSTEWRSIVRYPIYLSGKTLFDLTPSETYKVPKTILDKILFSIGFGNFDLNQHISLTEEVRAELVNASR